MNNGHSQFGPFADPSPKRTFSNGLSHKIPASGCPKNFVQEEPLDVQCLTTIWAICVVEGVSKELDILPNFWIVSDFGASHILTWVYADTASAACPSPSGSFALTSITSAAVIWDADEPRKVPESSFTVSPRSTTRPLYFWNIGSSSAFLRWLMSINAAKWTFFLSLCAFRVTSLLLFTFSKLPCWYCFELLPFLVHRCLRIRNYHRLRHKNKLVN